jgi:hypothetical protein
LGFSCFAFHNRGKVPRAFNHRKIPRLGVHFSAGGLGVNRVREDYHGHGYVVEPAKMGQGEFAAFVKEMATACKRDRGIVLFQPTDRALIGRTLSTISGKEIGYAHFQIIKPGLAPGREKKLREAGERGRIDIHIGDIGVGTKDKRLAIMRHLRKHYR